MYTKNRGFETLTGCIRMRYCTYVIASEIGLCLGRNLVLYCIHIRVTNKLGMELGERKQKKKHSRLPTQKALKDLEPMNL